MLMGLKLVLAYPYFQNTAPEFQNTYYLLLDFSYIVLYVKPWLNDCKSHRN